MRVGENSLATRSMQPPRPAQPNANSVKGQYRTIGVSDDAPANFVKDVKRLSDLVDRSVRTGEPRSLPNSRSLDSDRAIATQGP